MRHSTTPQDGNTTSEINGIEQRYKNAQAFAGNQRGPSKCVKQVIDVNIEVLRHFSIPEGR
jgi:hypothetical protein